MTRTKWARIGVAVAGGVAFLALASAAPAAAEPAGPPNGGVSIAAEFLDIGLTYRDGNTIVGYGSIRPPYSGTATITIQRSSWRGWVDVSSATVRGSGYDQYVYYNCGGTGTYDYRTLIAGTIGNEYQSKKSNTITASC